MQIQIRSTPMRFESWSDAMEVFWKNGWTDGLPVVLPTEEKIYRFLEYMDLKPDDEIAEYRHRRANITAEKLAINAVMAGCLPEYMPVVISAITAITDTAFHLNHLTSTSSPFPPINRERPYR